jgi:hypothetical protein
MVVMLRGHTRGARPHRQPEHSRAALWPLAGCATDGVRTLTPLNQRSTEGSVGPTGSAARFCTFRPSLMLASPRPESCVTKRSADRARCGPPIAGNRTRPLQHGHPDRRLAHSLSASRQRGQLPVRPERQDFQNDHCARRHWRVVAGLPGNERADLHQVRFHSDRWRRVNALEANPLPG